MSVKRYLPRPVTTTGVFSTCVTLGEKEIRDLSGDVRVGPTVRSWGEEKEEMEEMEDVTDIMTGGMCLQVSVYTIVN